MNESECISCRRSRCLEASLRRQAATAPIKKFNAMAPGPHMLLPAGRLSVWPSTETKPATNRARVPRRTSGYSFVSALKFVPEQRIDSGTSPDPVNGFAAAGEDCASAHCVYDWRCILRFRVTPPGPSPVNDMRSLHMQSMTPMPGL